MPVPAFSDLHRVCRLAVLSALLTGLLAMPRILWAAGLTSLGQEGGGSLASLAGLDPAMLAGALLGIIGASFLYLLATFMVIRDRSQIWLVIMLFCMLVYVMGENGLLVRFHDNPVLVQFISLGALIIFYASSAIFAEQYLEYDVNKSLLRFVLRGVAIVMVGTLLLAALDLGYTAGFLPWAGLAALALLVTAGLKSLWERRHGSLAFILAFCAILAGQAINILRGMGLVMLPLSGAEAVGLSFALCAILFAVVIAAQFARRQEKKEFELARSNERFQMAAMGSNEGLYDWDFDKNDGYFSNRLNRIFGINLGTDKAHILRRWLGIVHPDDRQRVRRALFGFLRDKTRSTLALDYRIRRMDGRVIWVSTVAVAVRSRHSRKPLRLVGSVGDITEKKRAEVRLIASERRFRGIAEAHPVPVLIAAVTDSEIVYATHGAGDTLHAPQRSLPGAAMTRFFDNADDCRALLEEVRRRGRVDLHETTLRRADDTRFPAAISARLIDYERRPCAVLGIYDLSERKAAEARIREAESALLQSEKLAALGGLLAGVAHELNNPLSVIVGQAVLLREGAKDEKTSQRAEKIQKAGERCGRIVRSFLALARRKPSERRPIAINDVIENSLELLAFQLRTDNVELVRKLGAGLPPAFADADQLTQVITNLVINAKQALQDKQGPRRITLETRHDDSAADGAAAIQVSVTDNGAGVPKEIMHRIFEPFFTTKPEGAGTGVGLSLCHSIVESHGGRIWAEDAPGGGARFVFTLPVNASELAGANIAAITDTTGLRVPHQRILIVDDEVELAQTLADILAPDGHTLTLAANGRLALERLAEEPFDVIISDLRMPVLDGPGLYRELEKTHPDYLSRILFVTGDTLSTAVSEFLNRYGLDVIEKPYTPDDVRHALAHLAVRRHPRSGHKETSSAAEQDRA